MQRRSDSVIVPALARAVIGSHGLHGAAVDTGLADLQRWVMINAWVRLEPLRSLHDLYGRPAAFHAG